MKISLIVAANREGVIGDGNALLWHLPKDLKRFKRLTMGKPILMGRKTFESIGRPLPGRASFVITRNPDYRHEGVTTCSSLEEAIAKSAETGAEEAFVIGGGEIYTLALPFADCLYLTLVHNHLAGDARFDQPDAALWELTASESHQADDKHAFDFEFLDLHRKTLISDDTHA